MHTYSETRTRKVGWIVVGRYEFTWNVKRLWVIARSLQPFDLDIEKLPDLDKDCWFDGKAPTARQVAEHAKQIYEADLSYPILLNHYGMLVDGTHRLAKAYIMGHKTIRAIQFEQTPDPDFVNHEKYMPGKHPRY